ncbi:hypothetical protein [Streptomyces sp. NPDC001678]|uniref:hypothetical protein n=1 Tax=Streptomyces sp. NPDC001678 TaxID=3364599 RepID=UPI00367A3AC4
MDGDLVVGVDESTLTQAVANLFGRPSLGPVFSGKQRVEWQGKGVDVSWKVAEPPVVRLSAPTSNEWSIAIPRPDQKTRPTSGALWVNFPKFWAKRHDTDKEATTEVRSICTVELRNNTVVLRAVASVVNLDHVSPLDKVLYRKIIIPKILDTVDKVLGQNGLLLPRLNIGGVGFGDIAVSVGDGRLAVAANLSGRGTPAAPGTSALSDRPFTVLLSGRTVEEGAKATVQSIKGQWQKTSGKYGAASWSAGVKLNDAGAQAESDPSRLRLKLWFDAEAEGTVDLGDVIKKVWDTIKKY